MSQPSALTQALLQRAGCIPKPERTVTMQFHSDPYDARVGVWWPVSKAEDHRPRPAPKFGIKSGIQKFLNLFNREEK